MCEVYHFKIARNRGKTFVLCLGKLVPTKSGWTLRIQAIDSFATRTETTLTLQLHVEAAKNFNRKAEELFPKDRLRIRTRGPKLAQRGDSNRI